MKNIIVIFVLVITLFSCTKEKQCYTCTFGTVNGVTKPPTDYCGPMPYQFKDAQGNDLPSYCTPK